MVKFINWFKNLFVTAPKSPNPYVGKFRGWWFNRHIAGSPNFVYQVWIANGFEFFEDCNAAYRIKPELNCRSLLTGLPRNTRLLIWEALMHDLHADNMDVLNGLKRVTQDANTSS